MSPSRGPTGSSPCLQGPGSARALHATITTSWLITEGEQSESLVVKAYLACVSCTGIVGVHVFLQLVSNLFNLSIKNQKFKCLCVWKWKYVTNQRIASVSDVN